MKFFLYTVTTWWWDFRRCNSCFEPFRRWQVMHVQLVRNCLSELTILLLYAVIAVYDRWVIPEMITCENPVQILVLGCKSFFFDRQFLKLRKSIRKIETIEESSNIYGEKNCLESLSCLCVRYPLFWKTTVISFFWANLKGKS